MGEFVNLNKYRKGRQRLAEKKQADANRAGYGRSKPEVARTRAESERQRKELDDKRLK